VKRRKNKRRKGYVMKEGRRGKKRGEGKGGGESGRRQKRVQ
jgi:hypothetical protein